MISLFFVGGMQGINLRGLGLISISLIGVILLLTEGELCFLFDYHQLVFVYDTKDTLGTTQSTWLLLPR